MALRVGRQSRHLGKWRRYALFAGVALLVGACSVTADAPASEPVAPTGGPVVATPGSQTTSTAPTANSLPSVRLSIPSIGFSEKVIAQGLRDGRINPGPQETVYFNGYERVVPGKVGTAVIAAHVAFGRSPGPFAKLDGVRVGDEISVTTNGKTTLFDAVTKAVIDKQELTTNSEVWGPNVTKRRLALVTCDDGLGQRPDGHRKANLVILAQARS